MRVGITERGDACLDLSWVDKLHLTDFTILITKNVTPKFCELVLQNKDKLIIHFTVTGFGGSFMEPMVPEPSFMLNEISKLVEKGFRKEQIVIRVDPIIPFEEFDGLTIAKDIAEKFILKGFKRIRYSYLDVYPHVRGRFNKIGLNLPWTIHIGDPFGKDLSAKYFDVSFECCAETFSGKCVGCISKRDFDILGIDFRGTGKSLQRKGCLCISEKFELLNSKKRCPHQCLYCYWHDSEENI